MAIIRRKLLSLTGGNVMTLSKSRSLLLVAAFASFCALNSIEVRGQGKQAVVILRSDGTNTSAGCEGGAEITYRIVYDARLNAKEEIRMLNGASAYVTRDTYEKSGKTKLRET
jgi:hypothetical protein